MPEMWDIYDINKNKTGKQVQRNSYQFKKGEYHIVVIAIIINSKNEILISKRAAYKKFGLMWECNGGSILAGETSLEGVLREIKEELFIDFKLGECRDKESMIEVIERYIKFYNSQRPCYAIGYDTPNNYYEKYINGEIECKDTFSKRNLTEVPKFVQKRMSTFENKKT